jgi:chromosome segregation ATPase
LSPLVEKQAAEIDSLKKNKTELESSLEKLRSENDKVVHENKILKRAVTIQQERQVHAVTEIEAARQYKVDAEDKMKRMEQMIMYLRYHLQSQQPSAGNDFMGIPPRPPDVY